MAINVKVIGVNQFKTEQRDFLSILVKTHTKQLADETLNIIQNKINNGEVKTRAGTTGNTAKAFTVEEIPNGHGVGNIALLNKIAKWWRHLNYGSIAIGANWKHPVPQGSFQPGNEQPIAGESTKRWEKGIGKFWFTPSKPIAPRNFIDQTLAEIPNLLRKILGK